MQDAIKRSRALYTERRDVWDQMVKRDMEKDVSWDLSAQTYMELYEELKELE